MPSGAAALDSDYRYLDGRGNMMRSRTELSVARTLEFLGHGYEYGVELDAGGRRVRADFATDRGLIVVVGGEGDAERYRALRDGLPGQRVMAIGHASHAARVGDLEGLTYYGRGGGQQGSIFMEDESFTFDYAHVLPLVEKCSVLHGHTSSVGVEMAGSMADGMLMDFGDAKRIVGGVMAEFDHKFFVGEGYVTERGGGHYRVQFDGPNGRFDLRVPEGTAYLLPGEATVENLSTEIIRRLGPRLPGNVEAVGVYIYEGYDKGSHAASRLKRAR